MARCVSGSVVLALLCIVVSAPPTHASNDDSSVAMARIKKMNQFNYGMLRVDGMPEEFEAFRATFGGPLSCGRRELVFAEPREACEPLDKEQITGRFVLVARGSCTFVDKARNAFNAGAAAVIVTNNQGGMLHMPMGNQDALNITIPVVMVNNATGEKLESTLADGVQLSASVVGAGEPCLVPALVDMWLQLDRPFSEAELRDAEAAAASSDTAKIAESCLVGVEGTDPATWFEGFTTQFGGAVAPRTLGAPIVAEPREACEPLTNEVEGHVAVVYRGTCPMIDKVRAAQAKGATAVMIVNHPLQGASRAIGDDFSQNVIIPAFMVPWEAADALLKQPEGVSVLAVRPHTAPEAAFDDLVDILQFRPEDWPATVEERERWFRDLIMANHPASPHGHWFRFQQLEQAAEKAAFGTEFAAHTAALLDVISTGILPEHANANSEVEADTSVLAPLLLSHVSHRALDMDGHHTEVAGANILCPVHSGSYHFNVPEFKRGSALSAENQLAGMLRTQLCIEKLLIQNAIAIGQTKKFLESQLPSTDAEIVEARLLRDAKAPKGRAALDVYDALASFSYLRPSLRPDVTVSEWLSSRDVDTGDAPAALEAGDAAGEATVSEDGEWSV